VRPERDNIAAPVLPGRIRWLNVERDPVMAELTAAGPVLVQFFDYAQLNSVRALPYILAWTERYGPHGLTTLGVHSPRFRFTAEREALAPALDRLGAGHPVADDCGYTIWHDYGCKGWPSLFLWGQGGALRWFHFGEGEYEATEEAIQAELRALDPLAELPAAMAPLRASDARGVLVAPPSDEVFPGGSASEPWRAGNDNGDRIELEYAAGGAHASIEGEGELAVTLDAGTGGEQSSEVAVSGPGLYDLALHASHERHTISIAATNDLAIYSLSFSAGVP
jgi:hypothetical protein